MQQGVYVVLLLLSLSPAWAQPAKRPVAVPSLHQRVYTTGNDLVYDTEAWAYDAGAPVRSTPLAAGNAVYVGTARGEMLALQGTSGKALWKLATGGAVHSSPALYEGHLYFSNNQQKVFCVQAADGKKIWEFSAGQKKDYPWRFDYFYSSPFIHGDKLFTGADDGNLYALQLQTGRPAWVHKARSIIRSSPVAAADLVLFGDMDGRLIALDEATGKERWAFSTTGDTLKNEYWGFDRKAILSSPVVAAGNRIVFGCRDGFLYCVDMDGKEIWRVNHNVSWAVSTVAVKDSFVVTGTSDGRFVQAVHLQTGRELWRFCPNSLFWSSAAILDDKVYIGSFDGVMYCLDLKTGRRLSQFTAGDKIMSSAVYANGLLYFGSDDGKVYALKGHAGKQDAEQKRFVYYEAGVNGYFRSNADLRIKNYLVNNGYKALGPDTVAAVLHNPTNAVLVFATDYFPAAVVAGGKGAPLRRFLDGGGRIVLLGVNPLVFRFDEKTKAPAGFSMPAADTVLGLSYGENDTRGMGGQFPCLATEKGLALNLPPFWNSSTFLDSASVDQVLGVNENGKVSAFVKNYNKGGRLVQIFLHPDLPLHLDAVLKAAEWRLD